MAQKHVGEEDADVQEYAGLSRHTGRVPRAEPRAQTLAIHLCPATQQLSGLPARLPARASEFCVRHQHRGALRAEQSPPAACPPPPRKSVPAW